MTPAQPVILVVEDEFLVRMLAVALAQDSGFDVLSAGTADEAIKILESRSDIRLVFTDVNMPGSMDSLRLAHAVRSRWPPVELIVTSGHSYTHHCSRRTPEFLQHVHQRLQTSVSFAP